MSHLHNGFAAATSPDGTCLFCKPARWEGGYEGEIRCENCRVSFTTNNPRRRFCTSLCRRKHWERTTAKGAECLKVYAERQTRKRQEARAA